jgi:hypothetical protein
MLIILLISLLLWESAEAEAATQTNWVDKSGDAIYPHLDVRSTILRYEDDDTVSIGFGTGLLVGGDRAEILVDVDMNPATGYQGADIIFWYERYIQGQSMLTGVWNGSVWVLVVPQTLLYESTDNSVVLNIARAELGSTRGVNVHLRGGHTDVFGTGSVTYSDRAPDNGKYWLLFSPPLLTLSEARSISARAMRLRTGTRRPMVSTTCTRLSAVTRRCQVRAARNGITWRGRMTVTEYYNGISIRHRYQYDGYRNSTRVRFRGIL